MVDVRIKDIIEDESPSGLDFVAVDGFSTRKVSLNNLANTTRPFSTTTQAEGGVSETTVMSPARTAESITEIGGDLFAPISIVGDINSTKSKVDNFLSSSFNWFDYIDQSQLNLIKNHDIDSQDEALVTSGIQAMMNAAMTFIQGSSGRVARILCEGTFAINDEIFSEDFAEALWNLTTDVDFVFEGDARFHAKNWISAVRVRTSGFYSDQNITDPVPTAIFRWEQRAKYGFTPKLDDWWFIGEGDISTDPIGFKARNINIFDLMINVESCAQGGIHISDMNNGSGGHGLTGVASRCGANITGAGGSGFLPSGARAAVTPGVGVSTLNIVDSDGSPYTGTFQFLPEHVGREIVVQGIGVNNEDFTCNIQSVDSVTSVTLDRQATLSCTQNVFTFTFLPVDTVAGSTNITLPPNMTTDLTGRYVGIVGAGSSLFEEIGTPFVRVVSHNLTTGAVVLARSMRDTMTNTALFTGPNVFIGKDDDQVEVDGVSPEFGHNNDVRIALRIENGSNFYSTISMFGQNILASQFQGTKWHGVSGLTENFGSNWACVILDNCKSMQALGCQIEWGGHSATYGKITVTGARNHIMFTAPHFGDFLMNDSCALVYTDPNVSGRENCVVKFSDGFLNAENFPSANQSVSRNGAQGLREHVQGTIWRRNGLPIDLSHVVNGLEVANEAPVVVLTDTNSNTQFRLLVNGGQFSVDYSADGDGIFNDGGFSWNSADGLNITGSKVSFTPTIEIGGTEISTEGGSYSVQTGEYLKAFGRAFVRLAITLSNKGTGTGNVTITLPSEIRPVNYNEPLPAGYFTGFTGLTANPIAATVGGLNDALALRMLGAAGTGHVSITNANLNNTTRIELNGWFEI